MGRKKIDMESYPEIFWGALKAAIENKDFIITLPAKNFAVSTRQQFHYFRRDVIARKHPGANKLANFMCTLREEPDGTCTVVFNNLYKSFETVPAPVLPQTRSETVNAQVVIQPLPKFLQEEDADKWLERFMKKELAEGGPATAAASEAREAVQEGTVQEEETKAPCAHEWGEYNCVKCGFPAPD